MFRRNRTAQRYPDFPPVEYIPISIPEMEVLERVLLHGDECRRRGRPDLGFSSHARPNLIAHLYQKVGAASVLQPDPARVRIPLQKGDFFWLENSIRDINFYRGNSRIAHEGQQLLNRFNALLGQQRAVIYMGGTPVFSDTSAYPAATGPELPAGSDRM